MKKFFIRGRLLPVCLCAAGGLLFVLLATGVFPYFCPIRWTFGVSCPGCGMTRALAALLRLDFAQAFRLHPLVLAAVGYGAACMGLWLAGKSRALRSRWLWVSFSVLFLGYWILRLASFLQGNDPEFLEPRALFPSLFRFLAGLFSKP